MTTKAGDRIAAARRKAKLTGKALAFKASVTASWVRSVETGRTVKPAPDKLARVAAELGLDVRELLAMTDQLGAPIPPLPVNADLAALIASNYALAQAIDRDRAQRERLMDVLVSLSAQGLEQGVVTADLLHDLRTEIGQRGTSSSSTRRSSGGSTPAAQQASAAR